MLRKFKSLAYEKEFGYSFDSQSMDMKAPINQHFRMFQTYGDGLIQHSGDWSITVEYLADYLASLALAMSEDEELLENASWVLSQRPSDKEIAFAASVVWKEGVKTRYFSVKQMKVSASPEKSHDKRFEEIRDFHDGSTASIKRILTPEWSDGYQH